jgi:transglutaminase-like putative cysteine protease
VFATFKKGYCQYYAATMAVILRDMGVPTRIAEGFLPGSRDPNSGIELVQASSAHAWVEVYFEGYGWVPFNPTGGDVVQLAPLPSGNPVASSGPRSSASIGPRPSLIDRRGGDGPTPIGSRGRDRPGLIAVGRLSHRR